ncbi:MAG TPA: DUF1015 family protein [Candidatus Limnocylindrales bacterium]|nr:DUF1015 family protein [Candidatus Limnocylindrales bacterium]
MATVKPFTALRPRPDLAAQICELPYDVMSSEEARILAQGNPLSFLHVSKPEIDLPPGTDLYSPEVYATGKENFGRLIGQGALRQDSEPCIYLYRQIMGNHQQVGLVAVASCQEYLQGVIKKHEFTRPDKEDDRVRHIETLNSQTGPVFLVYRSSSELTQLLKKSIEQQPDIDFTAVDGVRHSAWVIRQPDVTASIQAQFGRMPALYIADGHHRCAAAARVFQTRKGTGTSGFFLSVIFPHDQVQILPYNRVLKDLNGLSAAQLLEKLDGVFILQSAGSGGAPAPKRQHELGLYLDGKWHTLHFRPRFTATSDPIEKLDVTLLQKYVLDPIFGIDDPRTSKRLNFVGGIRGVTELEKLVNSGEYACAFAMCPTSIEELMTIADAGGIMPPKSTWFEPKLRDAMFCHMI